MELLSPFLLWNVCGLVIWVCLQNKSLNIHPTQIFARKSFLLFSLSRIELHEKYTNEEVEEEERSQKDEEDEEQHVLLCIFLPWSLGHSYSVNCLKHDIRPSLET